MRAPLLSLLLLTLPSAGVAQDACATQCNQQQSECLRVCGGDPRDVNKPGQKEKLVGCLKQCKAETEPCRQQCKGPHAAPVPKAP